MKSTEDTIQNTQSSKSGPNLPVSRRNFLITSAFSAGIISTVGISNATTGYSLEYDIEVDAEDGPAAIQSALDDANSGDVVQVNGDGDYTWTSEIAVPNHVTLNVSNDVSVTVPSNHNLSPYTLSGSNIYSIITNADRSNAENVTIRGGEYDLSEMTNSASYAGVWLHNASDSLINDVICRGAGQNVTGSSHRSFNLCITNCTDSVIRDSEGHDAGYDNIGVRGGNENCNIVRSGGTGGDSGTIQTARWGGWGLDSAPSGTTFEDCWGRRIYCHDGSDTVWDGCESDYRLQTIGTDNALIQNTEGFEGKVFLYTLNAGSSFSRVENMDFSPNSSQNTAIQIGVNGSNHGTIEIDGISGSRERFVWFSDYGSNADIDTVEITDTKFHGGDNNSSIISQESGAAEASMLRIEDCEFHDFDSGITGSYDSVRIHNCEFHNISGDPIDVDTDDVKMSGNEKY